MSALSSVSLLSPLLVKPDLESTVSVHHRLVSSVPGDVEKERTGPASRTSMIRVPGLLEHGGRDQSIVGDGRESDPSHGTPRAGIRCPSSFARFLDPVLGDQIVPQSLRDGPSSGTS